MNIEKPYRKDRLQAKERHYTQREVDEIVKEKDQTLLSQYAVLKEVYEKYQLLQQEHEQLKKKLSEYENPDDGYRKEWTWVRKIVFVLEQAATPLRTKEIIEVLEKREPHLKDHLQKNNTFLRSSIWHLKQKESKEKKEKVKEGFTTA